MPVGGARRDRGSDVAVAGRRRIWRGPGARIAEARRPGPAAAIAVGMRRLLAISISILAATACGGMEGVGGGGDFGATVGGVKDLHLARDLIARGFPDGGPGPGFPDAQPYP